MTSFKLDIDLLPINVVIYKKKKDDFILVSFSKKSKKSEFLGQQYLSGCRITDIFPDVKQSGLFETMQRVELRGETENINVLVYHDQKKVWQNNEVVKLEDGAVAVFNNNCCVDSISQSRDIQLEQGCQYSQGYLYAKPMQENNLNSI